MVYALFWVPAPPCAIPSAVLSQSDRLGPLLWRSWQEKVPAMVLVIATTVGKILPSITLNSCFKDSWYPLLLLLVRLHLCRLVQPVPERLLKLVSSHWHESSCVICTVLCVLCWARWCPMEPRVSKQCSPVHARSKKCSSSSQFCLAAFWI